MYCDLIVTYANGEREYWAPGFPVFCNTRRVQFHFGAHQLSLAQERAEYDMRLKLIRDQRLVIEGYQDNIPVTWDLHLWPCG